MPHIMEAATSPGQTDGVIRAEALALHLMNHLIATVEMAHLDTATTSLFMLAEILAGLEVFAGFSPREAVDRVTQLTAERIDALRTIVAEQGDNPGEAGRTVACPGLRVLH